MLGSTVKNGVRTNPKFMKRIESFPVSPQCGFVQSFLREKAFMSPLSNFIITVSYIFSHQFFFNNFNVSLYNLIKQLFFLLNIIIKNVILLLKM